jgi:hypothetical protein
MASSKKSKVLWLPGCVSADSSGRLLLSVVRITETALAAGLTQFGCCAKSSSKEHHRLSHPPRSSIEERKSRGQRENWP